MDGNYEDIPMKKQQLGIMIGMMRITMDETRISYYDNIMIIISKIKHIILLLLQRKWIYITMKHWD